MKIRIYSPEYPFPMTEGAHQVIGDQIRTLLALGHEVELVIWKSPAPKQPFFEKLKLVCLHSPKRIPRPLRILSSFVKPDASPELYYYPPELDERAKLGEVDLAIYHYSFAYAWLR